MDSDEYDDLVGILIESRSQLRKLQWYAEVNKRGFVKILKKFDKKIGVSTQSNYLASKIYVLPFTHGNNILDKLNLIKTFLSELAPDVSKLNLEDMPEDRNLLTHELRRTSTSTSTSSFSDLLASDLKNLVTDDQAEKLQEFLDNAANPISSKVLLPTLSRAVSQGSLKCIDILLQHITSLEEPWDVNGRNVIHRFIISNSRQGTAVSPGDSNEEKSYLNPAQIPRNISFSAINFGRDGSNLKDHADIFKYLLTHLRENQRQALIARDENQRTPLHYACKYGIVSIVQLILQYLKEWDYLDVSGSVSLPLWQDTEGETPLDLAVSGRHPKTTQALFESGLVFDPDSEQLTRNLSTAARMGSIPLLDVLLSHGMNINQQEKDTHETPLFIACHLNHINVVQFLLSKGADTEIPEATYGWTPIFAAAVDGLEEVALLLKNANCDLQRQDESGWTPMEQASLRGHISLAEILKPFYPPGWTSSFHDLGGTTNGSEVAHESDNSTPSVSVNSPHGSVLSVDSAAPSTVSEKIARPSASPELIKSFGHGYLKNESVILLTLGNTDTRWDGKPIDLEKVNKSNFHSTQLDTALSLSIFVSGTKDESVVFDLPLSEDYHFEQIPFYISECNDMKLYFDLVPTYSAKKKIIARAVALIPNVQTSIDPRQNLNTLLTVPLIEVDSLDVLGTISFGVQVIRPFTHPQMGIEKPQTYWKSLITTRVIGHRGLGKNTTKRGSLQLGENTLESFVQASNLGASYVEFDVQITKDHVPVIYHDFLVAETGIDVPMQALTLEQFLTLSKGNDLNINRPTSPGIMRPTSRRSSGEIRPRSKSLYAGSEDEYDQMTERIKFTRDFKIKGFKGNFRGHSIHSPFTTLEEALKTVPKHVGFNIECKYPMLDESEEQDMETFTLELNTWVEIVLKCVYDHGDGRDIIFSSFNPDVCIMLSLKQPSIPVLFLTEGGTCKRADFRASSLLEAIRFAKKWNLLGIVSECEPLIQCPRLVNVVKRSGLVCVTYGTGNNDPGNARLQLKSGVDAVIVDSVLAIRNGLTSEEQDSAVA